VSKTYIRIRLYTQFLLIAETNT